MKSRNFIKIDDSVKIIAIEDFNCWQSLEEAILSSLNHFRTISRFRECGSLSRIEIPSPVEKIGNHGFVRYE
jgi:hypothetical protein